VTDLSWHRDDKRLLWRENERGIHLSLSILEDTYSATGITIESVLEVMVSELADTLERLGRASADAPAEDLDSSAETNHSHDT
jgi:hypothetical protein